MLVLAWFVALAPLLWRGSLTIDPYYTDLWGSVIRVLTEFTAGAITYLIVLRLIPSGASDPSPRVERAATAVSVLMPLLVVAAAVFLGNWTTAQSPITLNDPDAEPLPPFFHLWLVPLLIIWIGALALSRRGQAFAVVKDLPRGCAAAYYPEANPLVPLQSFGTGSFTPTSKYVAIRLQAHLAEARIL